jgi:4-diphosphocytidyl-2-C-methyl-D-erythritol kinase
MVYPVKASLIKYKSSSKVKLLCPAKINLYLNILGKYKDGYHKIETVVSRINLSDTLTITLNNNSSKVELFCNDKTLQNKDNLCFSAAELLKKTLKINQGFRLFLKKKIPVGAGLGGGSSCAASTLLGINMLLKLNLPLKTLYSLGKQLGSDVNFFLSQSSFAYLQGKGEKVHPLEVSRRLHYFIIYPCCGVSTPRVYRRTKANLTKFFNNVKIIHYALRKGDVALLEANMFNVLEKVGYSLCPPLKKKRTLLKNLGFLMTGSGSALFTLVKDAKHSYYLRKGVPQEWSLYKAVSM